MASSETALTPTAERQPAQKTVAEPVLAPSVSLSMIIGVVFTVILGLYTLAAVSVVGQAIAGPDLPILLAMILFAQFVCLGISFFVVPKLGTPLIINIPSCTIIALLALDIFRHSTLAPIPSNVFSFLILMSFIGGLIVYVFSQARLSTILGYLPSSVSSSVNLCISIYLCILAVELLCGDIPMSFADASVYLGENFVTLGIIVVVSGCALAARLLLDNHFLALILVLVLPLSLQMGFLEPIFPEAARLLAEKKAYATTSFQAPFPYWFTNTFTFEMTLREFISVLPSIMLYTIGLPLVIYIALPQIASRKLGSSYIGKTMGYSALSWMGSALAGFGGGTPISFGNRKFFTQLLDWRVVCLSSAVCLLIVILFYPALFTFIPLTAISCFLFYIAIEHYICWLWLRTKHTRTDLFIIFIIVALIFLSTFWQALIIGNVISIFLYIDTVSRKGITESKRYGNQLSSMIVRSQSERNVLEARGEKILIIGFIAQFYIDGLQRFQKNLLEDLNSKECEYLILNLGQISFIDEAVFSTLDSILQKLVQQNPRLKLWIALPVERRIAKRFQRSLTPNTRIQIRKSWIEALAEAEEHLLAANKDPMDQAENQLTIDMLLDEFANAYEAQKFLASLPRERLKTGDYLFHSYDKPTAIYLVMEGIVHLEIEQPIPLSPIVIQQANAGDIVGEGGFVTQLPHSFSARAVSDCVVRVISRARMDIICAKDPNFCLRLNRALLKICSERISFYNQVFRNYTQITPSAASNPILR